MTKLEKSLALATRNIEVAAPIAMADSTAALEFGVRKAAAEVVRKNLEVIEKLTPKLLK